MRRRTFLLLPVGAGLIALAGCGGGTASAPARVRSAGAAGTSSVLDVARANNLSTFVRAVEAAGLTEQLSGSGPYTLFAPSDAAFRAAGVSPQTRRDELRRLLAYHIVPGQVNSSFMTGMSMNHLTSAGDTLSVDGRSGGIRVNNANLVQRDLQAGNGVIHVLDRVIRPA